MAHRHSIYDTDPHFSIDADTRVIVDLSSIKTVIVQSDHNSERFTFELPRYVDGHDMTLCDLVQIHYINIGSSGRNNGLYQVTDLQLSPDDDKVAICSWLVSRNATMLAGTLNFVVRFACTTNGEIDYSWSTAVFSGISITNSIDNSGEVVNEYADVLATWYAELMATGTENLNIIAAAQQKASKEIDLQKQSSIDEIGEYTATMLETIPDTYEKVSSRTRKNDKRLVNAESRLYDGSFVVKEGVGYTEIVDDNVLPYAELSMLGGTTRKCTNLFDVTKATLGYRCNTDGTIVENTRYVASDYIEVLGGTSYYLTNVCGNNYTSVVLFDESKTAVNNTSLGSGGQVSGVINVGSNIKYIRINIFTDMVDVNTVMVNEGTTALPYEPYFDGLRSAPVTEVESVGANLIPYPYVDTTKSENGVTFTDNGDGSITVNGTASATTNFRLVSDGNTIFENGNYYISLYNGTVPKVALIIGGSTSNISYSNTISKSVSITTGTMGYFLIQIPSGTTVSNVTVYPMLNKGTTALPYAPYIKNTLPIFDMSHHIHGYDWRINDSVYNYIDFEKKQFVKHVGVVNMGTLDWSKQDLANGFRFSSPLFDIKMASSATTAGNAICSVADTITNYDSFNSNAYGLAVSQSNSTIFMSGEKYNDMTAEQFKSAMSGVMLYYELAEPESIDISDKLAILDGYGCGVSEDCYNYIDFENKRFVKMLTKVVFSGAENIALFATSEDGQVCRFRVPLSVIPKTHRLVYCERTICSHFEWEEKSTGGTTPAYFYDIRFTGTESYGLFTFPSSVANTASDFKNWLAEQYANGNPVTLYYELAEPVVTDISDILSEDNYIGVEDNGTVTFVNKYGYDILHKMVYQKKFEELSNTLKRTISGSIVSMNDVSPLPHKVKVTTRSKNLLDISKVVFGSQLVNNGDGSVTINTPSASSAVDTQKYLKDLAPDLKVGDECVLTFDTTGSANYVYLDGVDSMWTSGHSRVITESDLNSRLLLYASGTNTSAVISNIQIELGSTPTEYTPYVSDDTVVSVVSKGANLLPIIDTTKTHTSATIAAHNGIVTVVGTSTSSGGRLEKLSSNFELPVGKYVLSATSYEVGLCLTKAKDNTLLVQAKNDTVFTIKEPTEVYFGVNLTANIAYNYEAEVMLNVGETASEYEPYKQGETVSTTLVKSVTINSVAPNMTVYTNNGVIVEVTYNRDANVVVAELERVIDNYETRLAALEAVVLATNN